MKKTARQIAPITRSRYLQPILLAFVQQASPVATLVQAGSGLPSKPFPQEYLGIKAYARAEARTTPRGWNTDSIAKRKRRFFSISDQQNISPESQPTCGMNSMHIVVSMGIFPPTPKPLRAVRTRIPL